MQCKNFVNFNPKYGISHNISDIDRKSNIEKIGDLPSPAHKLQQIDGGKESGESS